MAAASIMFRNKFPQMYACVIVMVVVLSNSAESTLLLYPKRAPPAQSRFSTAVFQYSVQKLNGSNPCMRNGCSFACVLDDQVWPCRADRIVLKNLTVNRRHNFLLNVTTQEGEGNSSAYSWYIDTIAPTATITSEQMFVNGQRIEVDITFSEPCTGLGGFKCFNPSNCDVRVSGPAQVQPYSLQVIKPGIKYGLEVILSSKSTFGRVMIRLADNICTDQAGNQFIRSNASTLIIHFDRRPVVVDIWSSVPSYELKIDRIPRTVIATNKTEDLIIFLDFSLPVANSTEQILNALHVNSGFLVPIHGRLNENRRFAFKLIKIRRSEVITVELQAASILGRTGTSVSPVAPITFLYDSIKPGVVLRTRSPSVTKEPHIDIIAEFTKPVFGFEASMVEVSGGRLIRLKELSKALYSLTVLALTQTAVSVTIPAGKVTDISGNENMASNELQVKQYSTPPVSIALQSFVTSGTIATSLAAAIMSLSIANLEVMNAFASVHTKMKYADFSPSMNLQEMIGHLQVFALSSWFSVKQPIEYLETTRGLLWLLPHHKLPWKDSGSSIQVNHALFAEGKLVSRATGFSKGTHSEEKDHQQTNSTISNSFGHELPFAIEPITKPGGLQYLHNIRIANTSHHLPLSSSEYFTYFLRGEPMSAVNVIKRMENYKGWRDLEMNLFWLGVGGGSLVLLHIFTAFFIRWRTAKSVHGSLSFPRFELFLLILMLPCISQSSTFVIKGGTIGGIITGALLLAIPAAFILSILLFLVVAIFSGSFVQYKEVRQVVSEETWYLKLWFVFTGRPTIGKWMYKEGLPSSFILRFGILFDSWKGPPVLVFVDQNDPNTVTKWMESSQSGVGRLKPASLEDVNEETKIPMSRKVLGCARSSYIIVDILRRVCLGIISVAYSSRKSSKSLVALIITLTQFIYLFIIKPYISRGIQGVESISLMCEIGVFGIFIVQDGSNPSVAKIWGQVMLVLLLFTFSVQLINVWYAMTTSVLRLSVPPHKNSFRNGLKFAAKGLILPFLPRQHWSRVISASSLPETGLSPVDPLTSGTEFERRRRGTGYMDQISAMTATVVPVLSPGTPSPNVTETRDPATSETAVTVQREVEWKRLKRHRDEHKNELKKLREMAKASFYWDSRIEEASTSYRLEEESFSSEATLGNLKQPKRGYRCTRVTAHSDS